MREHHGEHITNINGYEIVDCQECGFIHCLPIPEADEITDIYKHDYYSGIHPEYLETVEKDRQWHEAVFNDRIKVLEKLVPGRNLLEIGSGPGLFLQAAVKRGWKAVGYEPSSDAWGYSTSILGMEVKNCFFNYAERENYYDAAYLGLVLEHIPDPAGLLRNVRVALKSGGAVCIAVPNDFSLIQNTIISRSPEHAKWWLASPHHINYFNFASLEKLLEKTGFKVMEKTTTFPIDLFLLMGIDYTGNPELGRQCHGIRMKFEKNMKENGLGALLADLYKTFAAHGAGRECVIYAIAGENKP